MWVGWEGGGGWGGGACGGDAPGGGGEVNGGSGGGALGGERRGMACALGVWGGVGVASRGRACTRNTVRNDVDALAEVCV